MQSVEIQAAVDAQDHGLAIDHELALPSPQRDLDISPLDEVSEPAAFF
jgi:hypothetical protein